MSVKPSVVCQLCGLDDYLQFASLPDDVWEVTCANPAHPAWTWSPTPEHPTGAIAEGIAAELDLFTKLPTLVSADAFDEYGIVEYRFGIAHPRDYASLLELYGHRAQRVGRHHTMSAFLAGVLRRLHLEGDLDLQWGRGTGYWDYLDTVSYWSRATDSPLSRHTWGAFASGQGLDPRSWPLVKSGQAQPPEA